MCIFCGDDSKGLSHWGWASFENFASSTATSADGASSASSPGPSSASAPVTSSFEQEVTFISGVAADGTISNNSYWGSTGRTAHKFGETTAGTGASITYGFDAASNWSATERATFVTAMDMWSAIANVTFTLGAGSADVLLVRGPEGAGAKAGGPFTPGSGSTLGQSNGQWIINMETSVFGFELSGSFVEAQAYGLNTILHEVGHVLGLGHGGAYNQSADEFDPAVQRL